MSTTTFTSEELEALEEKSTLPRFVFFPAGLVGITALAAQWPSDAWGWQVFWTLFTAYALFCWTSCFHETAHQTLCGSARVSIWLGRALGAMMVLPYTIYRESHIRHHAYLNKPGDWELWPYSDPNASLGFRRCFVWVDLFFGIFMAPYTYGRIFFHKNSPLKSPEIRGAIRFEYFLSLVLWSSILGTVAWFGAWSMFLRAWLVPHFLTGVLQNGRKFTEHLGMSSYDPMLGTRTVIGPTWLTRLCTYLNFDIFVHGPHHRHPRIAHDLLREKMSEYMEHNPRSDYPVFRSYTQAVLHTIPFMFRNPGVGMNAGAPAPGSEKNAQVENFVADVSQEILADTDWVTPHTPLTGSFGIAPRVRQAMADRDA